MTSALTDSQFTNSLTDHQVRLLRTRVYGPCTDANWAALRERWMRPENIAWLQQHAYPLGRPAALPIHNS